MFTPAPAEPVVLVVEDRDDARTSLALLLNASGFHTREAATGADALRITPDSIDIVVLDIGLPDLDGFEVLRRLRASPDSAHLPVVLLSGRTVASADRAAGLECGADAFFTKPADPPVLIAQLRALLRVRRAEEAGRRAREVLNATADAVVFLDADGRITYANPRAEHLQHGGRAQLHRRAFRAAFPGLDRPEVEREFRRARADRVSVEFEAFCPVVGAWLEVRAFPSDGGLSVHLHDVSDRRRAEADLRLRDRAIRAVPQGILITDPGQPDNPVVYVSPGFERLTGYAAGEATGRNCRFLQGPDTDPAAVAAVRKAVRAGAACEVELLNYRKDGTPFWNALSVTPVRDEAGALTHFVGVQTDVTERRRLEDQLRQAQKMEAVGRLAGGVAHDFNNLLTVIVGYGELLVERLPAGDPTRAMVESMTRAGERAVGLTRQLLAFSRQTVLEPRVLDPNALVRDLESMLRRLLGEDVDLRTALAPDAGQVRVDPGQLEQSLVNLCVNARDAMPTGGRLTIETRNAEFDEEYAAARPGVRPGRHVQVAVSDTGTGIPAGVRERIFEPFFTTKGVGKGTGLGLSMVFGFVKQSGGHVEVYSEPGRGATFKLYLPRVAAAPEPGASGVRPTGLPRGTETVLLVEDEGSVRAFAAHVLGSCRYAIVQAENGPGAVRALDAHAGPVHLVMTDVVMPGGMGGREVAGAVLARHPKARVLYTSGYTDDAVVRHGVLAAGVHFLQKPFAPRALTQKVREVLDSAR